MQRATRRSATAEGAESSWPGYLGYLLAGVGAALGWTGIGLVVAWVQGELLHFADAWVRLQGFPLISMGVWLCLIVRSQAFSRRLKSAMAEGVKAPRGLTRQHSRLLVIAAVWI